ncbi:MAG TPA: DUF6790 family protein [Pseudolabrys sp.]|nr:DUF6790 family protein [Pseudolabrys sp.]
MHDIVAATIVFLLSNFTLTVFGLGLVFSAVAIARAPRPIEPGLVVDKLIAWFVFFNIGVGYLYNFVLHAFFGEMTARFIGWADSPFQFEVATASLGFSVVGFLAAFRSFDLRLAAILGPGIFTLGAAVGHVREMVTAHNFAPGNAGVIFWTDILGPLIGFLLLWLQARYSRARRPSP